MEVNEIIAISMGHAGARISSACWDLIRAEHGIDLDKREQVWAPAHNKTTFFFASKENENKKIFTPHAVMVDLEPTVINEIKTGIYKDLFDPNFLIAGDTDAGHNFARGYYYTNNEMINNTVDRIRTMSEKCNNLDGFLIFRSLGGGTGSGFASLLLEHLENDYKKMTKIDFAIHPADITGMTVESYNSVFSIHNSKDYNIHYFMMDNGALYKICCKRLGMDFPMYENLNRLQAYVVSNITAFTRCERKNPKKLRDIYDNVMSCKKQFFLTAFAPLTNPANTENEPSVDQVINACFDNDNQMVMCDVSKEFYTNTCLFYRTYYQVNENEVERAISSVANFSDSFCGVLPRFTVAYIGQMPLMIHGDKVDLKPSNKTVATVSINTIVAKVLNNLATKFEVMHQQRMFVHHYLAEGMEEDTFRTAETNMKAICDDYKNY